MIPVPYEPYEKPSMIKLGKRRQLYVGPCRSFRISDCKECVELENADVCRIRCSIDDFSINPLYAVKFAVKAVARMMERYGEAGVCCGGGCGRTGTVSILYLVAYEGYSAEAAVEKFCKARGCGPETLEQWLIIAMAETLRREGLRGDSIIERLEKPQLKLEKLEITMTETVSIGRIAVAPEMYWEFRDELLKLARQLNEKMLVPVSEPDIVIDAAKALGEQLPSEAEKLLRIVVRLREKCISTTSPASSVDSVESSAKKIRRWLL